MTNIPSTSTTTQQFNNSNSIIAMSNEKTDKLEHPVATTAQIEDGELPEDGEIMEDDEEVPELPVAPKSSSKSKETSSKSSKKNFCLISVPSSSQPSRSSNKSSSSAKYKDYDSVKTTKQQASQETMLNSWVSGVQKKSGKGEVADSLDPNEEYYGVAKTSGAIEDKILGAGLTVQTMDVNENDPASVVTHVSGTALVDDKDYRMEEGALVDQDMSASYGEDSDYRRHSPIRQDRRRRRSNSPNSPDEYQNQRFMKRHRSDRDSSPPQLTGRFRRFPIRPRWAEHTICKFFREGYCRDGDDCAYSHLASDSHRRTDLCKYYQHGYCKKGLSCLHLHGEYPCKAFHKGECSKEQCQYSHQALDDFTQPIFDQMMRDEELASRISLPSHPLRRKVLLPMPAPDLSVDGLDSVTSNDQSFIPPPSIVVPVLSGMPPVKTVEDKVMAQTGTYGFFNPITPVSSSSNSSSAAMHPPAHLSPFNSPPNNNGNNSFVLPITNTSANLAAIPPPVVTFTPTTDTQSAQNIQNSPIMNTGVRVESKLEPESFDADDICGGFNINQMLEKITQQVNASAVDEVEDSPASPPSFFHDTSLFQDTKLIPVIRSWKLHIVDVEPASPINIDFKQIQTSPSLKNDPRVKKQVENQFDQGTENLKLVTSFLPLPSVGTSNPKSAKPIDPRTKDPRKKAAGMTPPTSTIPLPDSSTKIFEKLVEKQIKMANKLAQDSQPQEDVDVDHRPAFGAAHIDQHQATSPRIPANNSSNAFSQPSLTAGGFSNISKFPIPEPAFANLAPFEPPLFSNPGYPGLADIPNYGHTSYYSEPNDFSRGGSHQREYRGDHRGYEKRSRDIQNEHNSRWEHPGRKGHNGGVNTSPRVGAQDASSSAATAEVPLTLREKRKNNEYESPLARVTSKY